MTGKQRQTVTPARARRRAKARRIFTAGGLTFIVMLGLVGWQMGAGKDPVVRGQAEKIADSSATAGSGPGGDSGAGSGSEGREPGLAEVVVSTLAREVSKRAFGDDDDHESGGDDEDSGGWSPPAVSSGAS